MPAFSGTAPKVTVLGPFATKQWANLLGNSDASWYENPAEPRPNPNIPSFSKSWPSVFAYAQMSEMEAFLLVTALGVDHVPAQLAFTFRPVGVAYAILAGSAHIRIARFWNNFLSKSIQCTISIIPFQRKQPYCNASVI